MQQNESIIKQTKKWLNSFIIEYDICPFASKVVANNSIEYLVVKNLSYEDCLITVIEKCKYLSTHKNIETMLLIFPDAVQNFDDYLDFLAIANQLIMEQGIADEFQLASFHPDYCFEGSDVDDAANFTNKSPWPMLHLIRQESIAKALKFYKHPEKIPEKNIKRTRELGFEFLTKLRANCMSIK